MALLALRRTATEEILGCERESTESWLALLRSLEKRGVRTVNLVIADAHARIRAATEKCFATAHYRRCVFHFVNSMLTQVPKGKQTAVASALKAIFAQESESEGRGEGIAAHRAEGEDAGAGGQNAVLGAQ